MSSSEYQRGPSISTTPDVLLLDHVRYFLHFYTTVSGNHTPEGISKISQDPEEVEQLRCVVSDSVGVELTPVDIILGLNNIVTDIK